MSGICGGACAIRRLHELNSSAGAGTCRVTSGEGITPKQNAGCRSCESSSGIAVDVQQRLNCALPSFSLSSDSLSRFEVFTACPGSDQLIHSAELAVDLFNRSSNLENRRR